MHKPSYIHDKEASDTEITTIAINSRRGIKTSSSKNKIIFFKESRSRFGHQQVFNQKGSIFTGSYLRFLNN